MAPDLPSVSSFLFNILRWPLWSGCFSWCSKQTVRALKCLLPPGTSLPNWGSLYGWLSPRPFQCKFVVTLQYKFLENLEASDPFASSCLYVSVATDNQILSGHAYDTRFVLYFLAFIYVIILRLLEIVRIWWDDNTPYFYFAEGYVMIANIAYVLIFAKGLFLCEN